MLWSNNYPSFKPNVTTARQSEELMLHNQSEKYCLLQSLSTKTQNAQDIKLQCQALKPILDKILLKVSKIYSEHQKLTLDHEKLIEESKILGLKVGIGFEGSTPRPTISRFLRRRT